MDYNSMNKRELTAALQAAALASDFAKCAEIAKAIEAHDSRISAAIKQAEIVEKVVRSFASAVKDTERALALATVTKLQSELTTLRAEVQSQGANPRRVYLDPTTLTFKIAERAPSSQIGAKRSKPNAAGVSFNPAAIRTDKNARFYDALKGHAERMNYKRLGEILFAAGVTKVKREHFNENEVNLFSVLTVHERDDKSGKTDQTVNNGPSVASIAATA